jgi:hypothetical protein
MDLPQHVESLIPSSHDMSFCPHVAHASQNQYKSHNEKFKNEFPPSLFSISTMTRRWSWVAGSRTWVREKLGLNVGFGVWRGECARLPS